MAPNDFSEHDDVDASRLSELKGAIADGDVARTRRLIGELIAGWRPIVEGRLVLRFGREVADEAIGPLEEKLVRLLLDMQDFDQPWGQICQINAKWAALDVVRARKKDGQRLAELTDDVASAVADPSAETALDDLEVRLDLEPKAERLHRALAKLSDADRALLKMLYWKDMEPSDAAAALGIATGTLGVRRHRAITRLTDAFFDPDVIDPPQEPE